MGGIYSSLDQFSGITTLPVPVSQGGTGQTSLTDGAILVGNGTSPITEIGPLTDGQLLIGDTAGVDPVAASLTAPAAGFTITGGAGSITFALSDDLAALEGLATTGLAARTAANTWALRTITGTANEVTVVDGDGVAGNPTLSLPSNIYVDGISFNTGTTVLDTYVTGTFIPTIEGATGNPTVTYSLRDGTYTRIGDVVFYKLIVAVTTISGGSGDIRISGLPFTARNDGQQNYGSINSNGLDTAAAAINLLAEVSTNTTFIRIIENTDSASGNSLDIPAISNGDSILMTGFYWV